MMAVECRAKMMMNAGVAAQTRHFQLYVTVYAVYKVYDLIYHPLLLSFPSILTRQREASQTELTSECRKTSLPIDRFLV